MTRTVSKGFDDFLSDLTPTVTQRNAAAAHRASVLGALEAKLVVNRFVETGSFSSGTGVRHFSDVDALVSLGHSKPVTADTALEWVKSALQARFPSTVVRVSRPAVVIDFASGAESWELIPAFLTSRGTVTQSVYDVPAASSGWMDTAPLTHLDYVTGINTTTGISGGAKKLSRLLKAWKYYRAVPISSFYLEMRAAKYMSTQTSWVPVVDLCLILEQLNRDALPAMNDPSGASGRFYACSSDTKRSDALSKLSTAAGRARNALDAYNASKTENAFYYLGQLFNGHFPSYL